MGTVIHFHSAAARILNRRHAAERPVPYAYRDPKPHRDHSCPLLGPVRVPVGQSCPDCGQGGAA